NPGFAAGANHGARHARAEGYAHLVLLNNDVEVFPDFFPRLRDAVRTRPETPLTGLVYDAASGAPSGNIAAISSLSLVMRPLGARAPRPVDFMSGCLMVIPAAIAGGGELFDSRYFMYSEDYELCLRWRRQGVVPFFEPSIRATHAVGSTSD